MPSNAILHEVQQLYSGSDRLDSLAEKHPLVSEALIWLRVGTWRGKRTAALAIEVRTTVCMPFSGEEEAADPLASQLAPQWG